MKTIINTLVWMVLITSLFATAMGIVWLLQHYPWLGLSVMIGVVAWMIATVSKWPLKRKWGED